ncbi:cxxc_20_cxxc protein [Planococcus glaciei]|uniref:TIGR04104 family putative zinc finger protein n=1 Tax=Planococcus glaciei TaxID=459472 RepID=UPI0008879FBC|nr:TIGR04104 family putative zinc finger protein [Planococcus glaciei]SDI40173.1 cxxc_20_cxxc protein [Planococcus glaciei]
MPICSHCETRWTWKQTIKKTFTLSNKLECPLCGKIQYISKKSRKRISLLNLVILLPLLLNAVTSIEPLFNITLIFIFFMLSMVFMPFLTELSSEEEPLW